MKYTQAQEDQFQRTAQLDMRQAILSHIGQEARQTYIENAYAWAHTMGNRYYMAVYSFVTARYEDVIKDVRRNRLALADVKIILDKLVECKAIDQAHAQIWLARMPV